MAAHRTLAALQDAVATMLAALAAMLSALAIDPEPGPAILAVVLSISLSRSQLDRTARERLEAALALPLVALVAAGAGVLLQRWPWIGALGLTAGLSVPIWLRRFGPLATRAGSLIALPFVTLLAVPYVPATKVGPALARLMPVVVALLALAWVSVAHALARRARWLAPAPRTHDAHAKTESALRPDAPTRMAAQMGVALGASFVVGFVFFAERWSWIVLTAFIVLSGSRGRLDVAYKSVLRVVGAAGGTGIALVFTLRFGDRDAATVALILAAVFFGLWLRPLGYAWWALFVTIALALLQNFTGATEQPILWQRLEEIVIGAIIGVAAAWFVWPIRSTAVLRRRMADALAALSEALDPANADRTSDAFVAALGRVEQIAPAFRASRLVTRTTSPADWIDALIACRAPAVALIQARETPAALRKAVGSARRAVRDPSELSAALTDLRRLLAAGPAADTDGADLQAHAATAKK
ncbi:MAG TPA: FUSC family protein [Rhodanobacteraceae bacterium]|nr:FUSC family protein [Rhodanobacteraceae bacterium]